jgi:excisionase family DNA binding protein
MSSAVKSQFPVPLLLTPQKSADLLGIGRTRLLQLAKEGKIKVRRDGNRRYFITASLLQYVASLEERA